jgi:hypothetical protein
MMHTFIASAEKATNLGIREKSGDEMQIYLPVNGVRPHSFTFEDFSKKRLLGHGGKNCQKPLKNCMFLTEALNSNR